MAMGIVSDSDFEDEVRRTFEPVTTSKPQTTEVIHGPTRGRGIGETNVPNGLRKIIGEESAINGRASAIELASQFGLSPSSVSAYANGATSTTSYDRTPNKPHINQAKERISKRARGKLLLALSKLTGDKLDSSNAKDLSGVAKDMSAIVKNMEPDPSKPHEKDGGPTFVFYSPQIREERHFDVVKVKE